MVVFLFSLTRLIQSNLNSSSKNSVYISIIMTVYNSENCCRNELNDSKRIYLFMYLFLCSDIGLPLYVLFGIQLNSANIVLAISSMIHYKNYKELCCQQS